ncbi:MAG: hypothetical protein HAW65_05880 [Alphaproteobacteria bacterium]|nr:hypothetical protein [Alphaproteobacteria bacterium]
MVNPLLISAGVSLGSALLPAITKAAENLIDSVMPNSTEDDKSKLAEQFQSHFLESPELQQVISKAMQDFILESMEEKNKHLLYIIKTENNKSRKIIHIWSAVIFSTLLCSAFLMYYLLV